MSRALSGFTVVDLTEGVAGPFCTMMLGDLGAEIIKVEKPGVGDSTRRNTPEVKGTHPVFTAYNRNKKSIALDLEKSEGVQLLKKLLSSADVLIDNFAAGVLEAKGLDYGSLKGEFPGLICATITGFGATGPYRDRPVYEGTLQAECGMTQSIINESEGTPYLVGGDMAQVNGALVTAVAIQAALHQLTNTGKGQRVVSNMYNAYQSLLNFSISDYLFNHVEVPIDGNSPNCFVKTKTGWVRATCGDGPIWDRTVNLLKDPFLSEERFRDPAVRLDFQKELIAHVQAWASNYTTEEVMELFNAAGIPCGSVRTIPDLMKDPHLAARKHIVQIDVPGIGELPYFGSPYRLTHSAVEYVRAPLLGEHTDEILEKRLAMPTEEIESLKRSGVVA